MDILLKTTSRITGNLCFIGTTDFSTYVFEVSRSGQTLDYAELPVGIQAHGVCFERFVSGYDSYLITTNDNYIYQYSNGSLNTTYLETTPDVLGKIIRRDDGGYYVVNISTSQLARWDSSPTELWLYDLPFNGGDLRDLQYRAGEKDVRFGGIISAGTISFNDGQSIYIIRDIFTSAQFISKKTIDTENSDLRSIMRDDFDPMHTYVRLRQVTDIDQSSSSSSSSSESTDSTSSSHSSSSSTTSSSISSWSSESYGNISSSSTTSSSISSTSLSSSSTESENNFSSSSSSYSSSSTESENNVSSLSGACQHLGVVTTISAVTTDDDFYWTNSISFSGDEGYEANDSSKAIFWYSPGSKWYMIDSGSNILFENTTTPQDGALEDSGAYWIPNNIGDSVDLIECRD